MASDSNRLLGLTWFREKDYDKAMPHFLAARQAAGGPNPAAPPSGIDRLLEACERRSPLTIDYESSSFEHPALHLGNEHYTARQWESAIKAYDRVIRESRDTEQVAHALLHKGRSYYKLWEYDKALDCYLPFIDKYKDTKAAPAALLRAGVIYTGPMGDFASARRMYHLSLERYPEDKEAARTFNNLLYLDYWEGKLEEALAKSEEYVLRFPNGEFTEFHLTNFQPRLRGEIASQR
jgi:tetratricopeptide (TPR) repeat protein